MISAYPDSRRSNHSLRVVAFFYNIRIYNRMESDLQSSWPVSAGCTNGYVEFIVQDFSLQSLWEGYMA